jgi:hypothetical protein
MEIGTKPTPISVLTAVTNSALNAASEFPSRRIEISDSRTVCTEKLDSDVLVMKPADQGMRHDATDPLNRARDRRIFVQ